MKSRWSFRFPILSLALLLLSALPGMLHAAGAGSRIISRTTEVEGIKLHYLTAGHGAPLILLHGYAETSRMWKPIIPLLAEKFTVIAPDLPGIGDSGIPADGLDMTTAATRIHALARSQTKLTMPVLSIGGDKANGELLERQMKLVASDVTVVVLKDTGHWVLEERPKETTEALVKFV